MKYELCKIRINYLLIMTLALSFPIFIKAEILNPYVVDEKPQVLFGDSVPIDTYYGLENYTQDYVNGYAHFTFTYTHSRCCFAGYPPLVYITDIDPRSTTTSPIERMSNPAYHIPSMTSDPSILTDWYFYDIQFDLQGYSVSVKLQATSTEIFNGHTDVAGQTGSDWVSIANRYPSTPSNQFAMAFTPVPIKELATTTDPVIIIPGIMGSAYKDGQLVIDPILHTYDDLIDTLKANGYVEGVNLFTFPYEWRDSNVFSANLLDDKIDEVKNICLALSPSNVNCQKVDLVAHSMGGLVARSYIQSTDYDQDVDQLIFLGTPHRGAPTDYLRWEAGRFSSDTNAADILTESFFIAEALRNGYTTIFDYIHNRPILSVQELLPIFDYLKDKNTGTMRQYPNNYPQNSFLENLNSNISNLLNSGVQITNIIGDSNADKTVNIIRVIPTNDLKFWQHGEPDGFSSAFGDNGLERSAGDNTVNIAGSFLDSSINNESIIASHRRIPTIAESRVFNILTGNTTSTIFNTGATISPKILLLQLLSPIDVVVTAPDGKRIGKNFNPPAGGNTEYNEIPLAFYSGFQTDDEYITILNPLDGEYKVEVQGTGSGGEYKVLTSYISDTFSTTTQTQGVTAPNQITEIDVVVDNSNPSLLDTERVITLDVLIADINGAYDLGWIKDKKTRDGLILEAKAIIKFEKRKNGKLEKKIDKTLIKLVDKELDLLVKKGSINNQARDLLKTDLKWLINNN